MTRTALINAYQKTTGRRGLSAGSKERQNGVEIPGVMPVEVNPREVSRYQSHGIANVKIEMGNFAQVAFIVDTEPLTKTSPVQHLWLKQAPKILTVHISNGTNPKKDKSQTIDPDAKLEGLYITTTSLGRTTTSSQYKTTVIPLYRENPIEASQVQTQS